MEDKEKYQNSFPCPCKRIVNVTYPIFYRKHGIISLENIYQFRLNKSIFTEVGERTDTRIDRRAKENTFNYFGKR